ncbi:MAG TPA: hypothetical protein H9942_05290 [Candidatus Acutalibacter ornithocaccae]|uniref:Flavodoxin-like domain-containing protein n=1 Tax=Candidatus Acutalibacter ornithocaccae TaxID=2838416 RepID=A0A9D2LXG8_9FIRM|nr:hypothetical protein [Candidatus Acutalibacter ornithocaccae]
MQVSFPILYTPVPAAGQEGTENFTVLPPTGPWGLSCSQREARPAITASVDNVEDYDTIFVGYPIWWEEAPAMIATFLESYDFAGKTIVPFCTSSSDSIDNSLHIFTELCPDATIAQALTANNEADIQPWLQELGLL